METGKTYNAPGGLATSPSNSQQPARPLNGPIVAIPLQQPWTVAPPIAHMTTAAASPVTHMTTTVPPPFAHMTTVVFKKAVGAQQAPPNYTKQ